MEMLKRNSILIACLIILFGFSCKNNKNEMQSQTLDFKEQANILMKGNIDSLVLDISKFTNFTWEKFYVFKPYTTVKTIDNILGFKWDGASKSLINQSDDFNLLVFVEKESVVQSLKVPRNNGDFIKLNNSGPFYRNNAMFILKKENYGQQKWLFFYKK